MRSSLLWQVSVTTSAEAEEAISEFFERLFHQSPAVYTDEETKTALVSVFTHKFPDDERRLGHQLRAGLRQIRAWGLNTRPGTIKITRIRREAWAESWKKHFTTLEIRRALLIKPGWSRRSPRKGQAVVVLDPGLSFGTGQHPTTTFCLEQLVIARRTGQSQSILDIGTGSGILAIAAAKLGYLPVEAFDLDPVSVRVAKANAVRNRCGQLIQFFRRDLASLPVRPGIRFDLICANLTADLLVGERNRIINRLKPCGVLVLAGILTSQFADVSAAYETAGLKLIASNEEVDWRSASFRLGG